MGDVRSSSGSSSDSYIGSLISLISKSEIRYEGILYTLDTENSNFALQNVRSFGTEGRKKDGLQISPSDKVYDYIIFRGSDIKDLEVKSSPPLLPHSQTLTDPAVTSLQAQYSQSTSLSPAYIPAAVDSSIHQSSTPAGAAGSGSWVSPFVPPGLNGARLTMPVYWPGAVFYRPPGQTHLLHQQHLASHHFPLAPALQASPPPPDHSSLSHVSHPISSMTLSQLSTPFHSSALSALEALPLSASLAVPIWPTAILAATSVCMPETANMLSSSFPGTAQGISAVITPVSKAPRRESSLPSQLDFRLSSLPIHGISVASSSSPTMGSTIASSSQQMQSGMQELAFSGKPKVPVLNIPIRMEEVMVPPSSSAQNVTVKSQRLECQRASNEPLLPLPTVSTQQNHVLQVARSAKCFTEDFDFTAMNEKFNKDEVWGELGKGELEENFGDEEEASAEGELEHSIFNKALTKVSHEIPKKAVYAKDDFFDSLSCDALDHEGGRLERTKFSLQRKIDTETFGSFSLRARGSRGMRHRGRGGGGYRGAYNGWHAINTGRGNGYYGRGRGLVHSSSAF